MNLDSIDLALVERHLVALDGALTYLQRFRKVTEEDLRHDTGLLWMVERGLQLCIQHVVDVATHICARSGLDVTDYTGSIDGLVELGVLEADFAKAFRGVAGFRNVLVHGYLKVDLARVAQVLRDRLDDFRIFAERVEKLAVG